nr:unnamed protein product [Spirometra erinaceieuropaei]
MTADFAFIGHLISVISGTPIPRGSLTGSYSVPAQDNQLLFLQFLERPFLSGCISQEGSCLSEDKNDRVR